MRGHAADLGRARAGGVNRIEAVDVEGQIDREIANQRPRLLSQCRGTALMHLITQGEAHARRLGVLRTLLDILLAADADLDRVLWINQTFLDRPANSLQVCSHAQQVSEIRRPCRSVEGYFGLCSQFNA